MRILRDIQRFWDRNIRQRWDRFQEKEWVQKTNAVLKSIWKTLKLTGKWAYQLRSIVLAIPILICAGALAIRNAHLLPETVLVDMLGQGQLLVSRGVAVVAPLAVTSVSLLLMFCSKKVLYPWLISLLSLVLPLVIWLSNLFPA